MPSGIDAARIQIRRVIRAPRSRVYDAWTRPDLLRRWLIPGALQAPAAEIALRVGGLFRLRLRGKGGSGKVDGVVTGRITRLHRDALIGLTWSWEGEPETEVTVELRDVPEGTELTLTHERFASAARRDAHGRGWVDCLAKLDCLLDPRPVVTQLSATRP